MSGPSKPAAIRIRMPYRTIAEFVEGYRHHLSRAAAFVATDHPRPIGTILQLEFVLQSGDVILRGDAVVAREPRQHSRPGMLLRFLSLDDDSRDLLERICPPLSGKPDGPVLGIDFGGTFIRTATARRGRARLLTAGDGLPSAVAADGAGHLVIGERAVARLTESPAFGVMGPKRYLGRYADRRAYENPLPFPVTADDRGETAVFLDGRAYPVTRLCAELLRAVRQQAEEALGAPLQEVVVAVPAHFGDRQRSALRRAATEAGLNVEQLVNEASAVAVAWGAGRALPRHRLAVIDLGGSAFDCSVVQVEGDEIETLACGGDSAFGGAELDAAVAMALASRFHVRSSWIWFEPARRLREALSTATEVDFERPDDPQGEDSAARRRLTYTRADLEEATQREVARVVQMTSAVLEAGRIDPKACDDVLLSGGLAAMPLLRAELGKLFGRVIAPLPDPRGAVALGAALLAQSLGQREHGLGLREALSAPILVELPDGDLTRVFERHALLPAERRLTLEEVSLPSRVCIHQGNPGATEVLGVLELPIGPGTPLLHLSLSVDGVLQVQLRRGTEVRTLDLLPADARSELPVAKVENIAVGVGQAGNDDAPGAAEGGVL